MGFSVGTKQPKLLPPDAFLKLKICQKCFGGRGSAPDPAGGAYSAPPDPLAVMPYFYKGEGRDGGGRESEGEGRGEGRKGGGCLQLQGGGRIIGPVLSITGNLVKSIERPQTALQGELVLARSRRLELRDIIL